MKKAFLILFILFLNLAKPALAIYDPLSRTNNKVGVHLLSPDELDRGSKLINNDGKGQWGYVTVPIQASDRDRDKWTRFMKNATQYKVIPIIRVATVGNGAHWETPENNDLIDFANFLNDLPWPTQNRYVIIFNEVNRADEFGGLVNPETYADILYNAIDIFKSRSDKFFILPAGLDNAAPNKGDFMRWDVYLTKMFQHQPEVFNRIDGWTSHAYGNPDFSADPLKSGSNKADSFKYDLQFLDKFTKKKLPVFITEAGWSSYRSTPQTIANFYNFAFTNVWSNDRVVAVTPFLLFADTKPFDQFSLINKDGTPTLAYRTIQKFVSSGQPTLEDYSIKPSPTEKSFAVDYPGVKVLAAESTSQPEHQNLIQRIIAFFKSFRTTFKASLFTRKITVNDKEYLVETVRAARDLSIGLAKYNSLNKNTGMLFDFSDRDIRSFWMKDMKFDIDIVWITDNVVVGVDKAYYKDPYKSIRSPQAVDYVLELNQGSGVKVGDKVQIPVL